MRNEDDGPPCCMDHFLMARRLVEAGARVVTISFGRWDTHGQNFRSCRTRIPKLDMALSTLVEDLHLRGLDKDVSVVVWGEFGRTPKINKDAGRDHWPPVNFALLAGGGMRTGQVIGSTDKQAGYPKDRPISFQNVFATLYHNLGIDPARAVPIEAAGPCTCSTNSSRSAKSSEQVCQPGLPPVADPPFLGCSTDFRFQIARRSTAGPSRRQSWSAGCSSHPSG